MRGPHETFRNLYEGSDSAFKVCEILLELNWTSTASLLIDLWNGFESLRPPDWNEQTTPFQELARIRETGLFRCNYACIEFECVVQVTDHLVCGHFSPEMRHCGGKKFKARESLVDLLMISEAFHFSTAAE